MLLELSDKLNDRLSPSMADEPDRLTIRNSIRVADEVHVSALLCLHFWLDDSRHHLVSFEIICLDLRMAGDEFVKKPRQRNSTLIRARKGGSDVIITRLLCQVHWRQQTGYLHQQWP
jgi:hypothetical protein